MGDWTERWMLVWMDGKVDLWAVEQLDSWVCRRTDGQIDYADRQADRMKTALQRTSCSYIHNLMFKNKWIYTTAFANNGKRSKNNCIVENYKFIYYNK